MKKINRLPGDKVLVRRKEPKKQSDGGIHLPQTAWEKYEEGIVVMAGEGRQMKNGEVVPITVKMGDKVIMDKHRGEEFQMNGKEVTIIRERHILCITNARDEE